MVVIFCLLVLACNWASAQVQEQPSEAEIGSIQVYLTPAQARANIFPQAVRFEREVHAIPTALKVRIGKNRGRVFDGDSLEVYIAYGAGGALLGYGSTCEEIGKYRPITFMVGISADFKIGGAAILVYRESRGGEVRRSRFLRQYRGKSSADPIRINRDIVNITGATLSVRALNFGIKKQLVLVEAFYGQPEGSETP